MGEGPPSVDRAYLLAGRATRFPGKFLLSVDGETIVGREVRLLRSLGLSVTVVSVLPLELPGVRVVRDPFDRGPLGGLACALTETVDPFFLFGADMPFLDRDSLLAMRARYHGPALVPIDRSGHWQVLHAIYSGRERGAVEELLPKGVGLRGLVEKLQRTGAVDLWGPGTVAEASFADIDTPADLVRVRE